MSNINDQIMTPDVWGPHGWKFIHYITLGYPEYHKQMQKDKYKAFILLLKDVLPINLTYHGQSHYNSLVDNKNNKDLVCYHNLQGLGYIIIRIINDTL